MQINAIGLECPKPVILARKAMKANPDQIIEVYVDNKIATENLQKLANQLNYETVVNKISELEFEVILTPRAGTGEAGKNQKSTTQLFKNVVADGTSSENLDSSSSYIVVINSDQMGVGDENFSKTLLDGFLYALGEQDELPRYVILYNRGIFLSTLNENTIADLKKMQEMGVEVLSCGLCLENYELKQDLQVGTITNMYRICELMSKYRNVSPC